MKISLTGHKDMAALGQRKIQSLKAVRRTTKWGLKQSKEEVERFMATGDVLELPVRLKELFEDPQGDTPDELVKHFQELGFTVEVDWANTEECAELWLIGWKEYNFEGKPKFYFPLISSLRRAMYIDLDPAKEMVDRFLEKGVLHVEYFSCPDFPTMDNLKEQLEAIGVLFSDTYEPRSRFDLLFEDD